MCFSAIFIVSGIATHLGNAVEASIVRAQPVSFLRINRGDDQAISDLEASNSKNVGKGLFSFVLAVPSSILAAWLTSNLGIG